jgi:hypothetical protein
MRSLLISCLLFLLCQWPVARADLTADLKSFQQFFSTPLGLHVLETPLMKKLLLHFKNDSPGEEMLLDRKIAMLWYFATQDDPNIQHRDHFFTDLQAFCRELEQHFPSQATFSAPEVQQFVESNFDLQKDSGTTRISLKKIPPSALRQAVVQTLRPRPQTSTSPKAYSPPVFPLYSAHPNLPAEWNNSVEANSVLQLQGFHQEMHLSLVTFSPSGHLIAGIPWETRMVEEEGREVVDYLYGNIHLWGTTTGKLHYFFSTPISPRVRQLGFSADERVLMALYPQKAVFWDVMGGKKVKEIKHQLPDYPLSNGEIGPRYEQVAFLSRTRDRFFIYSWKNGRLLRTIELEIPAESIHYNSTGSELYTLPFYEEDPVQIWDPGSGRHLANLELPPGVEVNTLDIDSRGKWVAVGTQSGYIYLFDHLTGSNVGVLIPDRRITPLASVSEVKFDPEGHSLLVKYRSHQLAIWDVAAQKLEHVAKVSDIYRPASFQIIDRCVQLLTHDGEVMSFGLPSRR